MKTLSVQQPWASLICYGLKDVENRTWNTQHRGRVLIHASSKKVPKSFYDTIFYEMLEDIDNNIVYGNIPELRELPTSAIVGFVDITDCISGLTESMYDGGEEQIKWKLENAYLFDEPILNVNGKLNLWDYPDIDENNLPPHHKAELRFPKMDGDTLVMPVSNMMMEQIKSIEGERWTGICYTEEDPHLTQFFPNPDNYDTVEINHLRFESKDGETLTFDDPKVSVEVKYDENGDPVKIASGFEDGETELLYFHIDYGK